MRRVLIAFCSLLMLSSCFNDNYTNSISETIVANFNYPASVVQESFGTDSLYIDKTGGLGIGFMYLNFYHKLNAEKTGITGGFLLSRLIIPTSKVTEGLSDNTYRALDIYDGAGKNNIYLVYYQNDEPGTMPEGDMDFTAKRVGTCSFRGCYVTNTVEVADAVADNFKLGDRLVLRATGYLGGVKKNYTEMNLADFSAQKDSIVSRWTAFDLSPLGAVDSVDFELTSTNQHIPKYFCLDDVVADINISY